MDYLDIIKKNSKLLASSSGRGLIEKANGRFYTHEIIADHMISSILDANLGSISNSINVIDPFCGDGRLIEWLISKSVHNSLFKNLLWKISIWDNDEKILKIAEKRILSAAKINRIKLDINAQHVDTFTFSSNYFANYHICITNPPWETLKPDKRDLDGLSDEERVKYITALKERDAEINELFPLSKPKIKFSGWGTNLARVGAEIAIRLAKPTGLCAIVLPASLLADQVSTKLRKWIFEQHNVIDVSYYAAEARLFSNVDQQAITMLIKPSYRQKTIPKLTFYDKNKLKNPIKLSKEDWINICENDYILPIQFGVDLIKISTKFKKFPHFQSLEKENQIWAGRELDETGIKDCLVETGDNLFAKGRNIKRFGIKDYPVKYISSDIERIPKSVRYHRLVWRDVARQNQKRRIHATIIPPGWITGNSLHVVYLYNENLENLKSLLGILSSFIFEFQIRMFLATGHISLGAVRKARIPKLRYNEVQELSKLVNNCLENKPRAEFELEVKIAKLYCLNKNQFKQILASFKKLEEYEIKALLSDELWQQNFKSKEKKNKNNIEVLSKRIPNHFSAALSNLDLSIVRSVPPGGNWKNIPESIPSKRISQIRKSYKEGKGSRSTYYGRLRADSPSYTINTYFYRPGNGCHMHYDYNGGQHRVLSHREAARLQSFPDSFIFIGSKSTVAKQIGNAVPPLLSFQIAKSLGKPGQFVDLFCGAGGLSLGFIWAGWEPIVANDIMPDFLETYSFNLHKNTVLGDIRNKEVFKDLIFEIENKRIKGKDLWILGGPPCQGFSTAGNSRTIEDNRNWLFVQYKRIIELVKPAGFIFENVPGLLSMEKGTVFSMIKEELSKTMKKITTWILNSEDYAIPQRRKRVFLIGHSVKKKVCFQPRFITSESNQMDLQNRYANLITVKDALCDLPPLNAGEDGSNKEYLSDPVNLYQKFMRLNIDPTEYLKQLCSFD